MRIDELKKIAEENDYEFENSCARIILTREWDDGLHKITINKFLRCRLWISMSDECFDKDYRMIKAAMEFAGTPPDEREERKKFYLRHKWENKQFTFKEIEEIKEKYDTDLADFELVEVEDE